MAPIKPIQDAPVPPPVSRHAGIGNASLNVLERFFVSGFNRLKETVSDTLRHAVESLMESLETPAIRVLRPLITHAFDNPNLPPEVRAFGDQILSGEHQVELAMLIPIAIGLVAGLLAGSLRPFGAVGSYFFDRMVKSARLDPGTAIRAKWLDPATFGLAKEDLQDQGWSDERIKVAEMVAQSRLGVGDLLTLWRRKELPSMDFLARAQRIGFDINEISELKKATEGIPGPADLVLMQLREAWRDDVAERWGYDVGDITQFSEWMEKQGLSADWAKRYWRAHWVIPSAAQGFEMMWRGVISDDELRELLVINDLAPGWIDNLMQVARPVPGRIDRRYAYREGEIGWQELFDLYKMDGYTDTWAMILANTTAKMAVSEAKGLTRSAIEKAYRKRRLARNEAVAMLGEIGISEDIANFYLSQVDADRSDDLLDRRVDAVGKQFVVGDLNETQARNELASLQVLSAEIAVYLEEWSIARGTKTKRPTRSNLERFFMDGVIEPGEYRDQMDRLGYSDLYIDWYLSSLAIDRQQAAEKDERAARVEQERVIKDRRSTDYQYAKAKIDTNIAELQAAIASGQVAMVEAENERDRRLNQALPVSAIAALERDYQPALFDAEAAISEARLQITRLQTAIKAEREAIAIVDRSLIENVDMAKYAAWKAERLTAQTEQARLGELIAADRVAIAQLKEAIPVFEEVADVDRAKLEILALQTEMAQYVEQQAHWATTIEEIDELMAAALDPVRRQELRLERSAAGVRIAELEVEIAELREEIRNVQAEHESLERELEVQVTALPGREAQIAIRAEFQVRIAEIESNIAVYRENIAKLRLEKSALAVEWRE